jgi:lactate dehydrogenase-like 2-hydroxyacid dehydrogenase
MPRPSRFSPEVRERAVRMVVEHQAAHDSQWAAITSIAEKIGCTAETLRKWVRQAERDQGVRPGLTTEERQRLSGWQTGTGEELCGKVLGILGLGNIDREVARIGHTVVRQLQAARSKAARHEERHP